MEKDTSENITFEDSMQKLEKIVTAMESQKLPLKDMMKAFDEGKKLADLCTGQLKEFEKKIEILSSTSGDNGVWEEFQNK